MLSLHQLLDQPTATAKTQGMWQLARLCLDSAVGEQINVGVVFTADGEERPECRFVSDLSGLRCLYNDDVVNDAAFLIDQAEQALEQLGKLPQGWNVSLTRPLFVRGDSSASIIGDLYQRLVPLGMREASPERLDSDDHSHTTRNVRKTVRNLMRLHLNLSAAPPFWRASPLETRQDGAKVLLDLQIVGSAKGTEVRGSIASAWYKTQYHRGAYLDKAANALLTAKEVTPNAKGVLYLLQPGPHDDFTSTELAAIRDDIDGKTWLLKKSGASLAAFSTERAMAHAILEDMDAVET
jgi:hypothetical protein